jgi:hypothetical protein
LLPIHNIVETKSHANSLGNSKAYDITDTGGKGNGNFFKPTVVDIPQNIIQSEDVLGAEHVVRQPVPKI